MVALSCFTPPVPPLRHGCRQGAGNSGEVWVFERTVLWLRLGRGVERQGWGWGGADRASERERPPPPAPSHTPHIYTGWTLRWLPLP